MLKRLKPMLQATSAYTPLKTVSTSGLTATAGRGNTAVSRTLLMRKLGMKYDQVIDPENVQVKKFGITGIPHLILFGPDGQIVRRGMRGPLIEQAVKEALGIQ